MNRAHLAVDLLESLGDEVGLSDIALVGLALDAEVLCELLCYFGSVLCGALRACNCVSTSVTGARHMLLEEKDAEKGHSRRRWRRYRQPLRRPRRWHVRYLRACFSFEQMADA